LPSLPAQTQQILVWRTGVGIDRRYSRRQVAKFLGTTTAHVRQVEYQAAAALRQTASTERCGSSTVGSAVGATSTTVSSALLVGVQGTLTPLTPASPSTPGPHGAPRMVLPTQPPRAARSPASASAEVHSSRSATSSANGGFPFAILVAMGLLVMAAGLAQLARRRLPLLGAARGGLVGGTPFARAAVVADELPGVARTYKLAEPARNRSPAKHTLAEHRKGGESGEPAGSYDLPALLEQHGELLDAIAAYRHADKQGDPIAASNLGVLLEQQGDVHGALAAYRRADRRGDASGAFNLGGLLAEAGKLEDALRAYERADRRGDPAAATRLGIMLKQRGDYEGALAAYRRADARGDADGAFHLGDMLAERGELAGAVAAHRRGAKRSGPTAASVFRVLLQQHGSRGDALAAYRRARLSSGNALETVDSAARRRRSE
jgi:tetratricopeptide (TPR) repeat protein